MKTTCCKLALLMVVLGLALAGCDQGATYDFVVSQVGIDENGDGPAAGFNLDGRYSSGNGASDGCGFADRVSDLDPEENLGGCTAQCVPTMPCNGACQGGVDNQLPALTDALGELFGVPLRDRIAQHLAQGKLVFLMRLTNVNDLQNDPMVTVSLYRGWLAEPSCEALASGEGRFLVSDDSLAAPGEVDRALWRGTGSIVDGRLRVGFDALPPIAISANERVTVHQLTLRANVSENTDARGNLGGWVAGGELRDGLAALFPQARLFLDGVLPQLGDLPSSKSQCGGDFGHPRGGVALGLRFSLARARIGGSAAAAPEGACGTAPASDAPSGDDNQDVGDDDHVDNVTPLLKCPPQVTLECKDGVAIADYDVQAWDESGDVQYSCFPAPGASVPRGVTQVACSAFDGAQNRSSCAFPLTVKDTQPPVVNAKEPWNLFEREDPVESMYDALPLLDRATFAYPFKLSDCIDEINDQCVGALDVAQVGAIERIEWWPESSIQLDSDVLRKAAIDAWLVKYALRGCHQFRITGTATAALPIRHYEDLGGSFYRVYFRVADPTGNAAEASCRVEILGTEADVGRTRYPLGCAVCVGRGCGDCPGPGICQ